MLDLLEREDALATVRRTFPVDFAAYAMPAGRTGLVIIDEVQGFASVGCGPLAPPAPNGQVTRMIAETDRLARRFVQAGWPVCASLDSHDPAKPEPPYPPHCLAGTGHDELVPELKWLESEPVTTLIAKDCINFMVGAVELDATGSGGRNRLLDWINGHRLESVVTVGICTDICVLHTAADAYNLGIDTAVLSDCVASFNAQGHDFALNHFKNTLGFELVSSSDI